MSSLAAGERELRVASKFRMTAELQELSGQTTLWIVGVNLEALSGYTVWGGGEPDRFLLVDGRLVLARSISALLAELPPTGRHSFDEHERFSTFVRRAQQALSQGKPGDESGLYDFAGTLTAIRDREVLWEPNSGMAVDCLGAAVDLGRQFGEDSPGYRLARFGPLELLYQVIWGNAAEEDLDYIECEAAFFQLIEWIESIASRGGAG